MAMYLKVNGNHKEASDLKVKINGAWKQAVTAYTKVSGAWKECWAGLDIDTILYYGNIINIPVKTSGFYMRLYGLSITIKRANDGVVLQTITVEDTGAMLSTNYALKDGGSLSISGGDDRKSLDFEFWQSGSIAEVKIRKAVRTDSE